MLSPGASRPTIFVGSLSRTPLAVSTTRARAWDFVSMRTRLGVEGGLVEAALLGSYFVPRS